MLVKGSINYSPCGRKRKTKRTRKQVVSTKPLKQSAEMKERLARIKAEQERERQINDMTARAAGL